ncbi:restriction endonuclease subunit S [Paracoccus sanguinis]|uniref:restriction endonuclease subunit S n=1 Tax=Paracoccus sanguinis TaxID=1545044 RepID=UPI00068D1EB5|nr:restriction endonuclease subunit S [Paracoccus sanguinis]
MKDVASHAEVLAETSTWPSSLLGEIVDVLDSKRKPITKRDRVAGPHPYYGATGVLDMVEGYLFDEPLVLIGEDGAKWGAGDQSAFAISGKTWVNNHAHVLRPRRDRILDDWLIYYLNAADLSEFISGMTVPKLNQGRLREIPIPLPPLEEQKRIVAVLDQAFAALNRARAHAEANLADAQLLFEYQAAEIFQALKRKHPARRTVADVAGSAKGSIRTGPFGSQLLHSEFVDNGIAVLGIDNAVANEFRWAKRRYITEEKFRQLSRYTVHPGDVIITIMGTCGRCAVIPDDIPLAISTKHLCCITLDSAKCLPDYLHRYFLLSPAAREYLAARASGSIMDGLNMGVIKEMPISVPSLKTQDDVVSEIAKIEDGTQSIAINYKEQIHNLDTLRQSILQKAFSGELKGSIRV